MQAWSAAKGTGFLQATEEKCVQSIEQKVRKLPSCLLAIPERAH